MKDTYRSVSRMSCRKTALRIAAFSAIGIVLFFAIQHILKPKLWNSIFDDVNFASALYRMPENALQALFLGPSTTYEAISNANL